MKNERAILFQDLLSYWKSDVFACYSVELRCCECFTCYSDIFSLSQLLMIITLQKLLPVYVADLRIDFYLLL